MELLPEIKRADLSSSILLLKKLELDPIKALRETPEPPEAGTIETIIDELKRIGALSDSGDLTNLGDVFSSLPVEPWIARLLISGITYNCLDSMLAVAAILSEPYSVYLNSINEKDEEKAYIRANYARGSGCDIISSLRAVEAAKPLVQRRSSSAKRACADIFVNYTAVSNILRSKKQYRQILTEHGLLGTNQGKDHALNEFSSNMTLVSALSSRALYPNVAQLIKRDRYANPTCASIHVVSSLVSSETSRDDHFDDYMRTKMPGDVIFPKETLYCVSRMGHAFTRFIAYQMLQEISGMKIARTCTPVNPAALLFFTDSKPAVHSLPETGQIDILVDRYIQLKLASKEDCIYFLLIKKILHIYEDYVLSKQQSFGSAESNVRQRMIKLIIDLLDHNKM